MKKLFSVLCAAALCFTALTSCNKEEELKPLNPSFPSVAEGLLEISSADSLVVPFVIGEAKGNLVDVSAVSTNSLYNTKVEVAENNKEGNITIYAPEYILDATEFDVEVNIKDEENAREVRTIFTVTPKLYDNIIVAEKPANCYIATPGAVVKFPANIGNSSVKADAFAIDLLWQDEIGLFSKVVSYEDGIATVAFAKEKAGNAVLVARKADSTIVWSWHVWVAAEQPKDVTVAGVTFMDRNLGAVSTDEKNELCVGTVYQWGRKDPFPAIAYSNNVNEAKLRDIYDASGAVVTPTSYTEHSEVNNLDAAIANPMTPYFQKYASTNKGNISWISSDFSQIDSVTVATLWDNDGKKSSYDPCPSGYKVSSTEDWAAVVEAIGLPGAVVDTLWDDSFVIGDKLAGTNEKYIKGNVKKGKFRGVVACGLQLYPGGELSCNTTSGVVNMANCVGSLNPSVRYWRNRPDPKFHSSKNNFRGLSFNWSISGNGNYDDVSGIKLSAPQNSTTTCFGMQYALPVRCVKEK